MTCSKKIVRCTIITKEGHTFSGENFCLKPQKICPREDGEGYEKCRSICMQPDHAEIDALHASQGADLRGAIAIISGIDYMCRPCAKALSAAGVEQIILRTMSNNEKP